jgi:hypothetical protein
MSSQAEKTAVGTIFVHVTPETRVDVATGANPKITMLDFGTSYGPLYVSVFIGPDKLRAFYDDIAERLAQLGA